MKAKRFLSSVLFIALVLALVGSVGPGLAQGPGPQGARSPQDTVGTAFTYPVRLSNDGSPANGTYDFEFKLYDDASTQVGSTITIDDKTVTDSLFTVERASVSPPPEHLVQRSRELAAVRHDTDADAQGAGGVWQTEIVDAADDVGQHSSVALDVEDYPHISYYDATDGVLMYAYYDGDQWITAAVDRSADDTGMHTSLALDSAGHPRISYCRSVSVMFPRPDVVTYLMFASYDRANWNPHTIETIGDAGGYTSLALDSDGRPHISYYEADAGALKVATLKGSEWISETVDGFVVDVGKYTSLGLDENDAAHISYVDVTNHDLKYARWYKGDWQIHTVDSDRYVDGATSLALDSDGCPHISYHDARSGALCYAAGNGLGNWETSEVDSTGDVGRYNSLDLDIDDHAHISYYNATDGDLKYVSFNGTQWISETVDNGGASGDAGEYVSLALDSIDNPHVSYYHRSTGDVFTGDLKYAEFDVTAPTIISGPEVISTKEDAAVIAWQTDGACDSVVRYGSDAGVYDLQEQDPSLAEAHEVALTGLNPSMVYHYLVRSTDAAGNAVVSEEGFFETAPAPDAEPPSISSLTFSRVVPPFQFYKMTAPVFDNVGVEKVEFYLDDELIGVDYSGSAEEIPEYTAYLDPVSLGMTRDDFFKSHNLAAVAFDKVGSTTVLDEIGEPDFDPPNGELLILSPPPDYTLFFEDSVVPNGTFLDIKVYASEYEYDCLLGGSVIAPLLPYSEALGQVSEGLPVFEPPWCSEVERAVEKVEFYIDIDGDHHAEWVHTWIPSSDDDRSYTYSWDVGGLGPRSYYMVVKAYLSDGRELYANRDINIAREGIAVEREVVRYDNFYQVSLTVVNEGTFSIELDEIVDNLTSFQAINREGDHYKAYTHYSVDTQQCLVTIDFFRDNIWEPRITLGPGESKTVGYLAVPIRQAAYVAGFGIGADEVLVRYVDHGAFVEEGFDRPVNPYVPPLSLNEALRASDYLIVTNPERLFSLYSASEVDKLLSTMAELARWKDGILGYLSVPPGVDVDFSPINPFDVDDKIEFWGRCLQGSDGTPYGYLSNGYLLLVGEVEIVPAQVVTGFDVDWSNDGTTTYVPFTDITYADTGGDWLWPELAVGRAIGNSPQQLERPLETSLGVYADDPGYQFNRDSALLYGGAGCCWHDHMNTLDRIEEILTPEFFVLSIREPDIPDEAMRISAFQTALAAGQDVIYFIAHGSPCCCGSICRWHVAHTTLADHTPFVFGASCNTGNYEGCDDISFAETFLDRGAAVYLGSTQLSSVSKNCWAGRNMFAYQWLPHTSVGEAVRHLKRWMNTYSELSRLWICEYNLYGDPKFGAVPAGSTGYPAESHSSPTSTLDLEVLDYEVHTREGIDYVEIPGGGLTDVDGKPEVPTWSTQVDYPAGQVVQDVSLSERSGLVVTTGLHVPTTYVGHNCAPARPSGAESVHEGWFPEKSYSWDITRHPDGSSTLSIVVYPFYYNPQTTDVRFYKNYSFDVEVITSTVEVHVLATDENVYAQRDQVSIVLWLKNSGDAQDVIVDAVVLEESSGEVVDGLMLQSLDGLTGLASFEEQWDSSGVEPGKYAIEVEIRDSSGNVLDRAMEGFQLGIHTGEITSFTATPELFDIGDTVDISMVFSNTGTVPITGTAVIEIQESPGLMTTATFTHTIANLTPSSAVVLNNDWDTSGAEEGSYRVLGYVRYDSRSTDPVSVNVGTEAKIYLPLVLRCCMIVEEQMLRNY